MRHHLMFKIILWKAFVNNPSLNKKINGTLSFLTKHHHSCHMDFSKRKNDWFSLSDISAWLAGLLNKIICYSTNIRGKLHGNVAKTTLIYPSRDSVHSWLFKVHRRSKYGAMLKAEDTAKSCNQFSSFHLSIFPEPVRLGCNATL